jgi:hypothetical protein
VPLSFVFQRLGGDRTRIGAGLNVFLDTLAVLETTTYCMLRSEHWRWHLHEGVFSSETGFLALAFVLAGQRGLRVQQVFRPAGTAGF